MATLDNNSNPSSDDARNNIIAQLKLNKQFSLRQRLALTEELSREQAIDGLKDCLVHMAYQEQTYNQMLRQEVEQIKPV